MTWEGQGPGPGLDKSLGIWRQDCWKSGLPSRSWLLAAGCCQGVASFRSEL